MREVLAAWRARLILAAIAVAVLAIATLGLTYTAVFGARQIDVVGEHVLTRSRVLRIAGLDDTTNVFHLDVGAVETSLRSSPWVAEATVERDLPSTIRIRIVEREPVALVRRDGGMLRVAEDGTVLPAGDDAGLPEVRAAVGELGPDAWRAGARALAAMPAAARSRVSAVVVALDGSLTLHLDDGVVVTYGPSQDVVAKASALRAVLAWVAQDDVSLAAIDLSVPDAPTATTSDGAAVAP